MDDKQTRKISFIKAISWRILATLTTMTISYLVIGQLKYAITIGSLEVVVKIFLYYVHERSWLGIANWLNSPSHELRKNKQHG